MQEVKINRSYLRKAMATQTLKEVEKTVLRVVSKEVSKSNRKLLEDFLRDEISREISAGPTAINITNTLGGRGNLFSFLGYEQGSDPIGELAAFLSDSIQIRSIKSSKSKLTVIVKIKIPTRDDMDELAQLPWVDRGLVKAIENGISGLGAFLYSQKGFSASRSGFAVQASQNIYGGSFKPQKYVSEIIREVAKSMVLNIKNSF
jgi:hypothetical protein